MVALDYPFECLAQAIAEIGFDFLPGPGGARNMARNEISTAQCVSFVKMA